MGLGKHWRKIACTLSGGELIRQARIGETCARVPVHRDGSVLHAFREPWMNTLLPRLLEGAERPEVIDVGANIGQFLVALRACRPDARYAGFEPNARNYGYLQRLIALNGWPDVDAFPVALSESFGVANLGVRKESFDVFASLAHDVHDAGFFRRTQSVLMTTGDSMVEALGMERVRLLKVDVEGAELEVLRGFGRTLAAHAPYVVFEMLPAAPDAGEEDRRVARARDLMALLGGMGYRFRPITDAGLDEPRETVDPRTIARPEDANLLAVPAGRDLA
ncbi:FkbM family methyltransferase [Caenispirillum salinarum]|uniref:FkbM family methyltransferase n=1 Tax=Caenispirillum salinarum TaxID=859058 RepID=UPI00384D4AB6